MAYPKITIVTPSFNQGQFLEETIQSVIGQQYPNLEYIIMDGGSTDNSVEIIKKYEKHLTHWVSEKDNGQAAAINTAFGLATGDILGWLNSDDMYMPGTLQIVASKLNPPSRELMFGNALHIYEDRPFAFSSDVRLEHEKRDLQLTDYIIQPSSFWTKQAWEATGLLDESLTFGFDWDWYVRARIAGVTFLPEDKFLSVYRIHGAHKTGVGGDKRLNELAGIYSRHAGMEYQKLFARCLPRRQRILFTRKWIWRLRLSRFEAQLLKASFPALFRGFKSSEVGDMITML